MKTIDLKKEIRYIEQYIALRNNYSDLLLTNPINKNDTLKWFKNKKIEIRGIIEREELIGIVILYINKGGEVTIFVKDKHRGLGKQLISIVEKIAKENNLCFIYAWVLKDNNNAKKLFEKCGFSQEGVEFKKYNEILFEGIQYKKFLC
jgi:phosphinothricin acetyltransferase